MGFFTASSLGGGFFGAGVGSGRPLPALATVDSAMPAGTASRTQEAFGFELLVPSYSGNTANLRRMSDNATSAFGLNASKRFDYAAVATWAAGADVKLVSFIGQAGTGKVLTPPTEVLVMTGGTPVAFGGTTRNPSTGQLSRANAGAVGLKLNGTSEYLELATSGFTVNGTGTITTAAGTATLTFSSSQSFVAGSIISTAGGQKITILSGSGTSWTATANVASTETGVVFMTGLEVHILCSPNTRKFAQAAQVSADPFGGNNNTEIIWSYGTASNNVLYHRLSAGNSTVYDLRDGTGAGGTSQNIIGGTTGLFYQKYMTRIHTTVCDSNLERYEMGKQEVSLVTSAGNITANASMNNGTLRVGRGYGTSTTYGDIVFFGIIITQSLSAIERNQLHIRALQVVQHHRSISFADVKAFFATGDILLHKNANSGTGVLVGEYGNITLNFKITGVPAWSWNYTSPMGYVGLRNTNGANTDSSFVATNNFFYDAKEYSLMAFGYNESTTLFDWFCMTKTQDANGFGTSPFGLELGRDHAHPRALSTVDTALDTNDKCGTNGGYGYSDSYGGQISQSQYKYPSKTCAGDSNITETVSVTTALNANWGKWQTYTGLGTVSTTQYTNYLLQSKDDILFYKSSVGTTEQTITGATKANPCVITYTGADPANSTVVWISGVAGMTQLNGNLHYLQNVNTGAKTAELRGVNSTGYGTYTSGGICTDGYTVALDGPAPNTATASWVTPVNTNVVTITAKIGGMAGTTHNYAKSGYYTDVVAECPEDNYGAQPNYVWSNAAAPWFSVFTNKPHPNYDYLASQALREPYMKKATTAIYNSTGVGTLVGHTDCSIGGKTGWGNTTHMDSSYKIRSGAYQGGTWQGTALAWGFTKIALQQDEIECINVSLYKGL